MSYSHYKNGMCLDEILLFEYQVSSKDPQIFVKFIALFSLFFTEVVHFCRMIKCPSIGSLAKVVVIVVHKFGFDNIINNK